jgi:hypothetical protein
MRRRLLSSLFLALATVTAHAEPLAWVRLSNLREQQYENTPYHWLGDGPLHLVADVPPAAGYALDLLWGSKNDQRGAVVVVEGNAQTMQAGGYNGFRWQRITLPASGKGKRYELVFQGSAPKAAFLAAVRVVKAETPLDEPLPEARAHRIRITAAPPHDLDLWTEQLQEPQLDSWQRAAIHGRQANEALKRCRKYVAGWLAHADPKTGLIPENLGRGKHVWNGRNSAADNYAFMVLTCALTDRALFAGGMLDMLRTETKLTSRMGALPDHYNFQKQGYHYAEPDIKRMIFDGSEYVKDGLMPITEWLGHTPWSDRMIGIVDSILEHAPFDTPGGKIPSNDVEVNGEMMQLLSRLRFMTGNRTYLDMACRIADYYLLGDHHPTRNASQLKLRDHGCELISGLTEVYAACHALRKDKAAAYREPIQALLDRILEVGVNEHGLMYDAVNPVTGQVTRKNIGDNWGYNYNGFYTVYRLDGVERYRQATRRALGSLKPHYWKFAWQGWGSDGIADSVEGAINLFNREPDILGVPEWIDANTSRMLLLQRPDGVIEGWHGDGNYARTAILWVLWKQQGVTVQPWREDVRLGAVRQGNDLHLVVSADKPWQGQLVLDQPRHKTIMRMPLDYPRINQFPEWFAAAKGERWTVSTDGTPRPHTGEALTKGLPVTLTAGQTMRIAVTRMD